MVGRAAAQALERNDGRHKGDGSVTAIMQTQRLNTRYTSAKDFEVDWPDSGEETFTVTFTPDLAKSLTDPRIRVVTFNLQGEVVDYHDAYPWSYRLGYFGLLFLLASTVGAVIYWATRPDQNLERMQRRIDALRERNRRETEIAMARL